MTNDAWAALLIVSIAGIIEPRAAFIVAFAVALFALLGWYS